MKNKINIAILGGGISAAYLSKKLASSNNVDVHIFEKDNHLGGLLNSSIVENQIVDIGPFFFPFDVSILELFPGISDFFFPYTPYYTITTPKLSIDKFPLTIKQFVKDNGYHSLALIVLSIITGRLLYLSKSNSETYAKFWIGDYLYRKSGLKYYFERMFHFDANKMSKTFAKDRMGGLERGNPAVIVRKLKNRLNNKSKVKWYSIARKKDVLFQDIFNFIYQDLINNGVNVFLEHNIKSVNINENGKYTVCCMHNNYNNFDYIISSIPIPTFDDSGNLRFDLSDNKYVKLISLYFGAVPKFNFTSHYNHSFIGKWKRITDFTQIYGDSKEHILCVEYTSNYDEKININEMIEDFKSSVEKMNIFSGEIRYITHKLTHHPYPIVSCENELEAEKTRKLMDKKGIYHIGRHGDFRFLNVPPSLEQAENCFQAIMQKIQRT